MRSVDGRAPSLIVCGERGASMKRVPNSEASGTDRDALVPMISRKPVCARSRRLG